jgi:hypothetical protein
VQATPFVTQLHFGSLHMHTVLKMQKFRLSTIIYIHSRDTQFKTLYLFLANKCNKLFQSAIISYVQDAKSQGDALFF